MNVDYLIQLLTNRLAALHLAKDQAFSAGDLERINAVDADIMQTQGTITQLQLLQQVNQAAIEVNASPSEVVSIGLYAMQNAIQGPSASAVINGYDISAYATDTQYESKITSILGRQPAFTSAQGIDLYIQSIASGSPVTGAMVMQALTQYPVDVQLFMAIMELDSRFGTLGVGARTNNPGNIGNTGSATYAFPTWDEGVIGVAEWLNRHRAGAAATDTVTTSATSTEPAIPLANGTPAALAAAAAAQAAANQASSATLSTVASSTPSTSDASSTPDTAATSTAATSTDTIATSTDSTATSTAPIDAATSSPATSTDSNYGTSTAATN